MLSGSEQEVQLGWTQWGTGRPWLVLRAPGKRSKCHSTRVECGCSFDMAEPVYGAVSHSRGRLEGGGLGMFQPTQISSEGQRIE